MKRMRVGILTGGGDCAGLNAAIKWVVYAAIAREVQTRYNTKIQVVALKEGWEGILRLDPKKGLKDEKYVQMLSFVTFHLPFVIAGNHLWLLTMSEEA